MAMPRSAGPDLLALGDIVLDTTPAPALGQFIAGRWDGARSGARRDVIEPATSRILATLPDSGPEDLEVALAAARAAQREWAALTVGDRAAAVRRLADRVEERAERFGLLDARDTGSPRSEMAGDAVKGANFMRHMAGLGYEVRGDTIPVRADSLHYTRLQPWGVVARIIAFNHPTLFACGRLAPALMAGNAVILKPSELAPLGPLALGELAADLLPPGLLSVLVGGPALGAAIARHPDLRRLSFTGSVATALKIAQGTVESGVIKNVTYELGGKNPMLVFPDADLDLAAAAAVRGMNFTRVQGQSCGSTSRLFVHEDVHDDLLARIGAIVDRIVIGDPVRRDVEMGALITTQSRDRCLGIIDRAVGEGARVVMGGRAPGAPELAAGAFLEPTVMVGADHASELVQEEIFGPVLSVHRWRDREEAVRLANDVRYGLTAAIWTNDISQALRTADEIEAGYLWINDVETRYPAVPFGGWKDSGSGLEHGIEELISFTRTKAVSVRYL